MTALDWFWIVTAVIFLLFVRWCVTRPFWGGVLRIVERDGRFVVQRKKDTLWIDSHAPQFVTALEAETVADQIYYAYLLERKARRRHGLPE